MITLDQAREALKATPPPEVRLAMPGADLYGVITGVDTATVSVRFEGRTFDTELFPFELEFAAPGSAP